MSDYPSPLRTTLRVLLPFAGLLAFCACSVPNLIFEPKASDQNDGYEGSYPEAGPSTEMDWGPKQNLLLSEYKTLREQKASLEQRIETLQAENQNLKTRINQERDSYEREKGLRAQMEAQLALRGQRLGEQEAIILSLRIEKAKLEQSALLAKIDLLRNTIDLASPTNVEASAIPPANR